MKSHRNFKFIGDVGQRWSKVYNGWFTILDSKARGLEIMMHPKIAKFLGINDIGEYEFELVLLCKKAKR